MSKTVQKWEKAKLWLPALALLAVCLILSQGCSKDDVAVPTVTTSEVTAITSSTAVSGGHITDNGGAPVTARGVCWSTDPDPGLDDNFTEEDAVAGPFTSTITGLAPNTTYYVRACASNEGGTGYGEVIEFTTTEGEEKPAVITGEITGLDRTVATVLGEVVSDGGAPVTMRGFSWGTSPEPVIEDNYTEEGEGTGDFVSELSGLEPGTAYYVRAYATNQAGTSYGEDIEFTTVSEGMAIDADGNEYETVIIGDQEWFAQNLRTSRYNNGDAITGPLAGDDWADSGVSENGAYGIFEPGRPRTDGIESQEEMVEFYGKLYNWFAVDDSRGVCPAGWRVPDNEDWETLVHYAIDNDTRIDTTNVAVALKSCRQHESPLPGCAVADETDHPLWRANDEHIGRDLFDLGLLPGGFIHNDSGNSSWLTSRAYYWTSDEYGPNPESARYYRMYFDNSLFERVATSKAIGLSVRCIRE